MGHKRIINVIYVDDNNTSFKHNSIKINDELGKFSIRVDFTYERDFDTAIRTVKSRNEGKGFHAIVVDRILNEEISEYMYLSPLLLLNARKMESACKLFFISGQPTEGGPTSGILGRIFDYWSAVIPQDVVQCQKGAEFIEKFVSIMKQPQMSTISRPSR